MRWILVFLMMFMGTVAVAYTIDWYADGNIYQTTTCESGDDVVLPPTPEKYGYTFKGWKKNYYRGTFDNWESVPTSVSSYFEQQKPTEGDYIIIQNTSDFGPSATFSGDGTYFYWNKAIADISQAFINMGGIQ